MVFVFEKQFQHVFLKSVGIFKFIHFPLRLLFYIDLAIVQPNSITRLSFINDERCSEYNFMVSLVFGVLIII